MSRHPDLYLGFAAAGAAVWLVAAAWAHPTPFDAEWAALLLLLAPLALVPLGLRLAEPDDSRDEGRGPWAVAVASWLFSAPLLVGAFHRPAGLAAALMTIPWLVTTSLLAACGLARLRYGMRAFADVCLAAGIIYLPVGAAWAVASRAGWWPLDFEPVIVLLTAIHFHYAGFLLPVCTALAARAVGGRVATVACVTVILGVPLTAAGITATQLGAGMRLEAAAAAVMAAGGLLSAWLHLRLALRPGPALPRLLWGVATAALVFSLVLALLYGLRVVLPVAWLDIPWMRALHGTANALGFGGAGVLGWTFTVNSSRGAGGAARPSR